MGIAHGLDLVFLWAAPTAAIVFAIGWLVKEIPLRGGRGGCPGSGAAGQSQSRCWWTSRAHDDDGPGLHKARAVMLQAQIPPYGTASMISTVSARPFGRL